MTETIITLMNDVLNKFDEVEKKFLARFKRIERKIKNRTERLDALEKQFNEIIKKGGK